ncbi:MAG: hypothetical protein KF773_00980 [Deltaproteobacteria bacterium]|nr:hypothetical protein [Deltaproteobacteria bacterium]MCW5805949.1 hypothetical protein [Deltaproteobacteria bacterium]
MRSAAIVIFVATALAGVARAEPRGRGGATPEERREAIKNRIRGLRAQTLTDELKLDNTALGKVLPILSKWDDVTDKLMRDRADLQKRLAAADAVKDPRAVDKLVDDALANQKQFWDLEEKRLAELRRVLTPAQTAKLMVVLPTFERRIQRQLRRAARAPDADDEDDDAPRPHRR